MSDESRRILDLLAQGKITVDEADQLLRAVGTPASEPAASREGHAHEDWTQGSPGGLRGFLGSIGAVSMLGSAGSDRGPRYLKIEVHKPATEGRREKHVNIRVPVALVRGGMRLGAIIPGYAGDDITRRLRERGIDVDLSKLNQTELDKILTNFGEMTVDVDHGKAQVRITCE